MTFAKVQLKGRAGEDSVLRWTTNGKPIASFSIAVNKGPKEARRTIWFTAKAFGETAEALKVSRGAIVTIEGNLDLATWNDKRTGEKRERLEVLIDSWTLEDVAPRGKETVSASQSSLTRFVPAETPAREWDESDLPF